LAPLDDVTDVVFRRIINDCAPPDLFFTEFINVDALQSKGRQATLKKIRHDNEDYPVVAQLWGKNPENYYKSAKELVEMGFAGIDINMGCPEKNIVNNGCCSAFIKPENRNLACQVITAVKEAADGRVPVSVKTRLGFNEVDFSWHELLLRQNLDMLTIHGRTRKEMSKVPARFEDIQKIRELRDQLSPSTLIVGNGDVENRAHGVELAKKHGLDGIMIGRGVFHDPFCFAENSPWESCTKEERLTLLKKHVELFAATWQDGERNFETLKKFAKVYVSGFDGAKELREEVMKTHNTADLLALI
jgi:tRNA-dihydrouridine synthase